MKKLKTRSFLKMFPLIFIMLIGSGVLLFLSGKSFLIQVEGQIPFENVDYNGDLDGLYVGGTIEFIYDYYCETVEDNTVKNREYVIDAGDCHYIAIKMDGKEMKNANTLMQACYTWMDTYENAVEVLNSQFEVKGTIKKLSGESLQYYHEFVGWDLLTPIEQEQFLPYCIEVGRIGGLTYAQMYIYLILGILLLAVAIWLLVFALMGGYQRQIKRLIANSVNPTYEKEHVEAFLQTVDKKDSLTFGDTYIFAKNYANAYVFEADQLVWAYRKVITHKRYFITVGYSYFIVLGFIDGKKVEIKLKGNKKLDEYIEDILERYPRVLCEYSTELNNLYTKQLREFLNLKYYAVNEQDSDVPQT